MLISDEGRKNSARNIVTFLSNPFIIIRFEEVVWISDRNACPHREGRVVGMNRFMEPRNRLKYEKRNWNTPWLTIF